MQRYSDMHNLILWSESLYTKTDKKQSGEGAWFILRPVIDTQSGLTGADETNFLSFLCRFVLLKWDIRFQNSYGSDCTEMCRKSKSVTANTAADLQTRSSGGMIFTYSCYVSEHKCHFNEAGLYFDACFHLNTHISSPPARRAAERVSRSKIWLYHQVSIPAGPLHCLLLILQTGAGGLKLLLQWISPPLCFYLSGKHWGATQPCRPCLSVWSAPCLCYVEAWMLGFHKNGVFTLSISWYLKPMFSRIIKPTRKIATHAVHFIFISL